MAAKITLGLVLALCFQAIHGDWSFQLGQGDRTNNRYGVSTSARLPPASVFLPDNVLDSGTVTTLGDLLLVLANGAAANLTPTIRFCTNTRLPNVGTNEAPTDRGQAVSYY